MSSNPSRPFAFFLSRRPLDSQPESTGDAAINWLPYSPCACILFGGSLRRSQVVRSKKTGKSSSASPSAEEVSEPPNSTSAPRYRHSRWKYSVLEINNLCLPGFYGGDCRSTTWEGESPTGERHTPTTSKPLSPKARRSPSRQHEAIRGTCLASR